MKKSKLTVLFAALALLCAFALTGCGCMQSNTGGSSSGASSGMASSSHPASSAGSMLPGSSTALEQMLPEASALPEAGSAANSLAESMAGEPAGSGPMGR